jgi:hypothetical protein
MGRFFASEAEGVHWPVKTADLLARPSRRREFIDMAGDYALYGPPDLQAQLRDALVAARPLIQTKATPFLDCAPRRNGRCG